MCGWLDYEKSLCDGCRQKRDEASDPRRAWSVEKDHFCYSCQALGRVEVQLQKQYEKFPEANIGRRLYIAGSRKVDPSEMT